jgi:hypothetical protein
VEGYDNLREFLADYLDVVATAVPVWVIDTAKEEERLPTEREMVFAQMSAELYERVERQMKHLSSICEEPILDVSRMSQEEKRGLSDDIVFGRRDEKVAARVNLVLLHKPHSENATDDEYEEREEYETRRTFVPVLDITVGEALDYLEYWDQERDLTNGLGEFLEEWRGYQEIARLVGDEAPKTIGELTEYQKRLREEEDSG